MQYMLRLFLVVRIDAFVVYQLGSLPKSKILVQVVSGEWVHLTLVLSALCVFPVWRVCTVFVLPVHCVLCVYCVFTVCVLPVSIRRWSEVAAVATNVKFPVQYKLHWSAQCIETRWWPSHPHLRRHHLRHLHHQHPLLLHHPHQSHRHGYHFTYCIEPFSGC